MPKFSVYVPARKGTTNPDLTLRVDASNWLVALRAALAQIGEQGDNLSNIVCETSHDGTIRVADPNTKRVFLLKKLTEAEIRAAEEVQALAEGGATAPQRDAVRHAEEEAQAKIAAEREAIARLEAEKAAREKSGREAELREAERRAREHAAQETLRREEEERARLEREIAVRQAEQAAKMQAEQRAKDQAAALAREAREKADAEKQRLENARLELERLEAEKRRLEQELSKARNKWDDATDKVAYEALGSVGKVEVVKSKGKPGPEKYYDDLDDWYDSADVQENSFDDVLSDIFMETQGLHEQHPNDAAGVIIRLLDRQLDCEASSVFLTDNDSALKDQVIVHARGPVAARITGARVPLGQGIVGFSMTNRVNMTVNNVQNNPNFYGKLDEEHGFQTRSILCVPVMHEGRVYGALEALNKKDANWTQQDVGIMESLAGILARAVNMYGMIHNK